MGALRASARKQSHGAAAVEFALVVPLLLVLLFGIISYGYMLSFRQSISQGAAEGARQAALAPPIVSSADKTQRARDAINQALGSYGVTCSGADLLRGGQKVGACVIAVAAACPGDARRSCTTVRLDYSYRQNPLIPTVPGLGAALPRYLSFTSVAQANG
ncbi:TadE/TadG family type IV pilus assembly protein [Nocardioides sp.]|uniref:TadE/TadG family type IV pilus assembly protein n=1 Tax=Nocardioides sp. TaxID=35761 RepID=UPI003564B045